MCASDKVEGVNEVHEMDEETQWIQQVLEGDTEAFAPLVRRYEVMVRTVVAQRMGPSSELVEETAQEVFLKAFKGLKRFERRAKFSTWLYRIAVNQCQDVFRRQRTRVTESWESLTDAERERAAGPSSTKGDDEEIRRAVGRAWEHLAPRDREILTLREIEGHSYEEISEILGCPAGTVESRLFRARQALKHLVKEGR